MRALFKVLTPVSLHLKNRIGTAVAARRGAATVLVINNYNWR
jgi:hypothetical protein